MAQDLLKMKGRWFFRFGGFMRLRFVLLLVALTFFLPISAQGQLQINPYLINRPLQFDPCLNPVLIDSNKSVTEQIKTEIQNASRSMFCFVNKQWTDVAIETKNPVVIQVDRPISIYNLKLVPEQNFSSGPLLTIDSTSPVTLVNSTIKGSVVIKGKVTNGHHAISGGTIACPDKTTDGLTIASDGTVVTGMEIEGCKTGVKIAAKKVVLKSSNLSQSETCISITGDDAIIQGNQIHDCSEVGIKVSGDNILVGASNESEYDQLKNEIYNNGVGLHIVGGSNNLFPFNSIYENPSNQAWADDGILVDDGLSSILGRPTISLVDELSQKALHCEKAEGTNTVASRWLQFDVPDEGRIIIYEADSAHQGKKYLTECRVAGDGKCQVDFPASFHVPDDQCGVNLFATALFTSIYSTAYTSERFVLDGPISTILLPAGPGPIDIPGARDTSGSGNQPGNVALYDPSLEEGSDPEGAAGMSSSGGMAPAGCGASLVPDTSPPIVIWISLPLFPISYLLLRRKLLHRR